MRKIQKWSNRIKELEITKTHFRNKDWTRRNNRTNIIEGKKKYNLTIKKKLEKLKELEWSET